MVLGCKDAADHDCSKNINREQSSLSSEKELKSNSVRSHIDDIGRKTLRLGQLKGLQERRMRDEAALKELQETLGQLQGELKVSVVDWEDASGDERGGRLKMWYHRI